MSSILVKNRWDLNAEVSLSQSFVLVIFLAVRCISCAHYVFLLLFLLLCLYGLKKSIDAYRRNTTSALLQETPTFFEESVQPSPVSVSKPSVPPANSNFPFEQKLPVVASRF